ncbi:hypothetical protein Tco_0000917 [Tanacetum coccineum]
MSSDDASSTVTYTSVSSGSSEPSAWGIPLVNAGEIPNVDPYEEVAQHGQAHPLSPAYVPDPIELDEHVPLYVPDHPEHHDSSEENMPVEDQSDAEDANSHGFWLISVTIGGCYDAGEAKEDEPFEGSDGSDPLSDETAATPPPPTLPMVQATIWVIGAAPAARASRGQYDFVDAVGTGQGLVSSPGHKARTIARAADRAEDVTYARALQASEHRMMTSIEEVNLRTDRRDIRLEIDIVRGQRTAYETELQEVRRAYLKSEVQNRALLARLETLETHMTRMEWQRQRAEVRQIMRTHVLEARA